MFKFLKIKELKNYFCVLFSLILSNTFTKLAIELEREPTNLLNNSFLGGMLANAKTLSFSINSQPEASLPWAGKIPPKILKPSWSFANLFEILAGAISSSIPKTNANCPGIEDLILFQKEIFDWPKAILTNVFLAIFKLHPASFNDFLKENISFEETFEKSAKISDFCFKTFSLMPSICFVFCSLFNAIIKKLSPQTALSQQKAE